MDTPNIQPTLPNLPNCPFCNGAAELGWDTDGSLYLEVWHDQTCPTEGSPDGHAWCRWYYPEDWDDDITNMVSEVAAWWSKRDGVPENNSSDAR